MREIKEIKEELEAVIRASEVQMDAAERQRTESKKQFENDILSRDQLIAILQQQLRYTLQDTFFFQPNAFLSLQ